MWRQPIVDGSCQGSQFDFALAMDMLDGNGFVLMMGATVKAQGVFDDR